MLKRPGAEKDYTAEEIEKAQLKFQSMTDEEKERCYSVMRCWVCPEAKNDLHQNKFCGIKNL